MDTSTSLKEIVKQKYAQVAQGSGCCSGCGCTAPSEAPDYSMFNDDYSQEAGYLADADLNLGCGLPTKYAGIKEGNTVLDLGSGAGNDVFVARSLVGDSGFVYGLDMTPDMIKLARKNAIKLGYANTRFILGEIEQIPMEDNQIDVVVSNCVMNLVPDKLAAFKETFRVLKPGGHFCISDVVTQADLPETFKRAAELYAGCISGALTQEAYLSVIKEAGFTDITIHTSKHIPIPEELMHRYLSQEEVNTYLHSGNAIMSITVTAYKPS